MTRFLLCCLVALALCSFTRADSPPATKFDPTTNYDVEQIQGWTVRINKTFREKEPALCRQTLELLNVQLYQIPRVVPAPAAEQLRRIAIWVELEERHHPCMCYHSGPGWVTDNGMNPEKGNCVEVANARNFLTWTKDQPWMVLHELAHGYHDQFLPNGFENSDIKAAFDRAVVKEKRYDAIQRINGHTEKAYAATNPQEFFAESTESLFGTNDFYPYVAAELKAHDSQTYETVLKMWKAEETVSQ